MKTEKDVEHFIQTVIFTFKPALLFLTEVDPNVAERVAPPDYTLVRGTLSGETNIQVCLLIKVTQKYEIIKVNCDIPTVAVKILGWTFLGVYREWCHGKVNFDPKDPPLTAHQASLKHIQVLIDTMILDKNWTQLVMEITRSQ